MEHKKPLLSKPAEPVATDPVSQFKRLADQVGELNGRAFELRKRQLNADDRKILSYFWNAERRALREQIPKIVVEFLESDLVHSSQKERRVDEVNRAIDSLCSKEYLVRTGAKLDTLEVTRLGAVHLTRKHPGLMFWWARLLASLPPLLSFTFVLVGFLSSLVTLVQFVMSLSGS